VVVIGGCGSGGVTGSSSLLGEGDGCAIVVIEGGDTEGAGGR
jgi:hypothetical protein